MLKCRLFVLYPKAALGASRVLQSVVWPADTEQGFLPPEAAAAVGVSSLHISLKTSQVPLDGGSWNGDSGI